jgi:preprotein translocase subunit SecA
MARLKLKETLMPLLVKPDDEHKPLIPKQRNSKAGGGFSANDDSISIKNNKSSVNNLFPCQLSEDIETH